MFYDYLVNVTVIWYIFPRFGMLYQEKSGNPAHNPFSHKSVTIAIIYAEQFETRRCQAKN
jgi:hypothetical protein